MGISCGFHTVILKSSTKHQTYGDRSCEIELYDIHNMFGWYDINNIKHQTYGIEVGWYKMICFLIELIQLMNKWCFMISFSCKGTPSNKSPLSGMWLEWWLLEQIQRLDSTWFNVSVCFPKFLLGEFPHFKWFTLVISCYVLNDEIAGVVSPATGPPGVAICCMLFGCQGWCSKNPAGIGMVYWFHHIHQQHFRQHLMKVNSEACFNSSRAWGVTFSDCIILVREKYTGRIIQHVPNKIISGNSVVFVTLFSLSTFWIKPRRGEIVVSQCFTDLFQLHPRTWGRSWSSIPRINHCGKSTMFSLILIDSPIYLETYYLSYVYIYICIII